jgi:SAM-dependent methyltransferase
MKKEKIMFQPNSWHIFINPLYIIRRNLFLSINNSAKYLYGRMMDFGCGCKPYENLFEVKEYIGVDIKVSGHNHMNSKVDIYYDGTTLPFNDEYFDSVFSSEVFEHIANINEILKEINRVMKPGGKLLATTPFVWPEHEVPYDNYRYTSFGMKHLLESNGFNVLSIAKVGGTIDVLTQLLTFSILNRLLSLPRPLGIFIGAFVIPPINIFGVLMSKLFNKGDTLYLNLVVIAEKNKPK